MTDAALLLPHSTSSHLLDAGRWVAVWTKPRAEKAVARAFEGLSVPFWLPTICERRKWSDRWKNVTLPLFPNYLFAKTSTDSWPTLLRVPGILTVVKQGHSPAWIPVDQLSDLQRAVEIASSGELGIRLETEFSPGTRVRVLEGPLGGLRGVVREVRGSRRLLIGLEQIGRGISAELGSAQVEVMASTHEDINE